MMRRLLWGTPLTTSHIMWFDDDCRIQTAGAAFLNNMLERIGKAPMMGRRFERELTATQRAAVLQQPWYKGLPLPYGYRVSFPIGGWWLARTEFLRDFDWPARSLKQRGGDWLLGELLRQQQLPWVNYSNGVRIDATPGGKDASASPRGLSLETPDWGMDAD